MAAVPVKLESVPPVTTTSSAVKFLEASLSRNVIAAVVPALRVARLVVMVIVGGFVSIESEGDRTPCRLTLPAASVNFPAATTTVPVPVNPAVGVKVAV